MIPGDVRLVAAMPRTSSGKIDRMRTKTAVVDDDQSVLAPAQRSAT
jgi:acyl-coenzyme A synthetase/AMP-(fatty) acid ligase